MKAALDAELIKRRAADLYRTRRILTTPQGPEVTVNGKPMLAFCSNDYLGLAADARVVAALRQGALDYGVGSGAAHLVNGHMAPHHALEEALAAFLGRPRALLFSTGYMANLGVISALLGRNGIIWADRLNHASLNDGGILSTAKLKRYPHIDAASLEKQLSNYNCKQKKCLIATDGVFSMDGDIAPLPELAQIATKTGAWLMVDDAHGFGILGANGAGSLEHFNLNTKQVPILMATLGKALGVFGAFVAGEETLIETLIQQARSYVYTTALPPALAEATLTALQIVKAEPWRRTHLQALINRFRQGAKELNLSLLASSTPIQPIIIGSAAKALAWSKQLENSDILVPAIRHPTVPKGQARLRIAISAIHTEKQIDKLLKALNIAAHQIKD